MTASQRICRLDGFELILDLETARTAVDAGWPAVELYRCANGHSHREWPAETPRRRWHAANRPSAVCGRPLTGVSNQKYHRATCAAFAPRPAGRPDAKGLGGGVGSRVRRGRCVIAVFVAGKLMNLKTNRAHWSSA